MADLMKYYLPPNVYKFFFDDNFMTWGGFFRGIRLWLCQALLVTLIMTSVIAYAGAVITGSAFLKPMFEETVMQQIQGSLDEQYSGISSACNSKNQEMLPLSIPSGLPGVSEINVNCTRLKQNGEDELTAIVKEQIADKMFDSIYEQKACGGYACLDLLKSVQSDSQNALKLITSDFNRFLKSQIMILIGLCVIFGIFVLLLARGWPSKLMSLGGCLVTSGLPYFAVPTIKDLLMAYLNVRTYQMIFGLISSLSSTFLWILISGAVLFVVGLVLRCVVKEKPAKEEVVKKVEHHRKKK